MGDGCLTRPGVSRPWQRHFSVLAGWIALATSAWACGSDPGPNAAPNSAPSSKPSFTPSLAPSSLPGTESGAAVVEWSLETLSAEEGLSIRIPDFEVPAMREEQTCYFLAVPDLNDGQDFWVDHVRLAMNPGSHHMNIFRVRTIVDLRPEDGERTQLGPYEATVLRGHDEYQTHPCWGSANWADWPLVANTQHADPSDPYTDWQLPDGVAMRFRPGELLMVQTHYVNTSTQPTPSGSGKVGINLYRTTEAEPAELGTLFATQQNLRICESNPQPLFTGTCRFPGAVTITAANGHFHSRGKRFSMFAWDGRDIDHPAEEARFYTSDNWDHPPMETAIERPVAKGGGIWWDCQYEWHEPIFGCDTVNSKDPERAGDCCYTFGGNTDVGEHCNVFLYYYPRVADTDVFCN
jgi:hypothetical protein